MIWVNVSSFCQIHFGFGSAAGLEKYKDLDERAQLEREATWRK